MDDEVGAAAPSSSGSLTGEAYDSGTMGGSTATKSIDLDVTGKTVGSS
jgi:hypothetical protein